MSRPETSTHGGNREALGPGSGSWRGKKSRIVTGASSRQVRVSINVTVGRWIRGGPGTACDGSLGRAFGQEDENADMSSLRASGCWTTKAQQIQDDHNIGLQSRGRGKEKARERPDPMLLVPLVSAPVT